MTPQERELISGLFDRLSRLEDQPRDPEAERAIAQGLSRAPHAPYALVQTVLVQDEALKAANARIEELQAELGQTAGPEPRPTGFLDSMREAVFGGGRGGSVPSVRPASQFNDAPPPQPGAPDGQGGYYRPAPFGQGGYPPASAPGHSFLGTAAAAAAGMVGGSLLLGGIRSMLGGSGHGPFAGTFDHLSGGQAGVVDEHAPVHDSPWGGGADNLAGQAGLDDIDRDGGRAGLVDTDDTDDMADDDFGDSFDGGSDDA